MSDPGLPPIERLVHVLDLAPHPEGGYFRETYRSPHAGPGGRPASTLIYFLLATGQVSRLHRIDADEGWHLYLGGPLEIHELDPGHPDAPALTTILGHDLAGGQRPQHVVPSGRWFGATLPAGVTYALVGCSVAPGFDFGGFELADRARMLERFGAHRDLILRLT